jgi:hypothetical protein
MEKAMKNVLMFTFCLYLLLSCDTTDPDPCAGRKPVTAEFEIRAHTFSGFELPDCDTVANASISFKAIGDYDSYEWKIGYDDRTFTTKEVSLAFYRFYGDIPIRLIVRSEPNIRCFPEDDGIDTAYRTMTIIDWRELLIYGDWFGRNVNYPNDTFTVNINYTIDYLDDYHIYINNLNKGCYDIPDTVGSFLTPNIEFAGGYNGFDFDGSTWAGNNCLAPYGVGWIHEDNYDSITIDYYLIDTTYPPPNFPRKHYTFKGVRKK